MATLTSTATLSAPTPTGSVPTSSGTNSKYMHNNYVDHVGIGRAHMRLDENRARQSLAIHGLNSM